MSNSFTLFTDGGARGNPGPAATGIFLFDPEGKVVDFAGKYLGETTNNQAEYRALLAGIELAIENKVKDLTCYLDSELVVMQVNGAYQVKNKDLRPLYLEIKELKEKFDKIVFAHVRREKNKLADKMVNTILDAR